jgi:outer membrane protein assembly factor BamB
VQKPSSRQAAQKCFGDMLRDDLPPASVYGSLGIRRAAHAGQNEGGRRGDTILAGYRSRWNHLRQRARPPSAKQKAMSTPPAIGADNTLYVTSLDGKLYAF